MTSSPHTRDVFPVSLLAAGRACLIVGGGKVALRKVNGLLAAGAKVTVVSPDLHPELVRFVQKECIAHIPRVFATTDVRNMFLVFAATNDKAVNRSVCNACRERGILCCSVDGNWVAGDFVTPATLRKDGLTIAVSTGGRSCRRSRLVKEGLSRHIRMVDTAELIVLGTSHNYLSVEKREPYHLVGAYMDSVAEMVMRVWGVHEFMLLNTCNRIELIAVASGDAAIDDVIKRILGFDHLDAQEYYGKRGVEAFSHLACLTAGLLSQIPGENHIVAQVKDAVAHAVTHRWAAGMIQEWVASALHVAKNIRQATSTFLRSEEIEDLCLNYLESGCPDWNSRRVMVLGGGVMGTEIVERLLRSEHSVEWCYHRNKPAVADKAPGLQVYPLSGLRDHLGGIDVIICATSSEKHVLHEEHAAFFDQQKNVVIVDLTMPRNVAPELNALISNLSIADLDDLKHWYRREMADMAKVFEISDRILAEHRDLYEKLINSFQNRKKDRETGVHPDAECHE